MLKLINQARKDAEVAPVELGSNRAAQHHADAMAEHCFGGHWGLDGTTSVMRYTLAGGRQKSGENVSTPPHCTSKPLSTAILALEEANKELLGSPGHRKTMLDPIYRFVNIGIAWSSTGLLYLVQQFEGDYVRYTGIFATKDGMLELAGRVVNGAVLGGSNDLGIRLYYSPPIQQLTKGQLARTACIDPGLLIAQLSSPPQLGLKPTYRQCPSPYGIRADLPGPESTEEAIRLNEKARIQSQQPEMTDFYAEVQLVPVSNWEVRDDEFAVSADISGLLEKHGPGVYDIHVAAVLEDELHTISIYSIFYQTDPPDTYGDRTP